MNRQRMWVVARTDLKQLIQARDFWIPMMALGAIFFLVVPSGLLLSITKIGNIDTVQNVSQALEFLPQSAQDRIPEVTASGEAVGEDAKVAYALAVYLLAPIAVVVPLTISTAVGASTIVGERERGTGEFLAHSPADVREIYTGKLIASLLPGYFTAIVGFGIYALIVNLTLAPEYGRIVFPTDTWWLLMFFVVPPFVALTLSLVLRLSARVKSSAAAQQASGLVTLPLILIAYGQSAGAVGRGGAVTIGIGVAAWILALISLSANMRSITRARLLGVADEQ